MSIVNKDEIKVMLQEAGCSFQSNSRSFILTCPRCNKNNKLYIRQNDGRFVCWRCKETDNFQGRAEYALVELTSLSLQEIRARLYGDSVVNIAENQYVIFNPLDFLDEDEELYSEFVLARTIFTPDIIGIDKAGSKPGADYLESRGISLSLAMKYDIHYSPVKRRVIFPVKHDNQLYGWQARTISSQQEYYDDETDQFVNIVKAVTSTGLKKDKTLMFRDNLIGSQHCVLCEGPVDAIKADLIGGNVCTMGKAVSFAQMNIIKSYNIKRLYLALDPDAASEMRRILDYFRDIEVYDMRPRDSKDLGEMSLEQAKNLFLQAKRLTTDKALVYIKDHYAKKN